MHVHTYVIPCPSQSCTEGADSEHEDQLLWTGVDVMYNTLSNSPSEPSDVQSKYA